MNFPEPLEGDAEGSKQAIQKLNQHHHRVIDLLLSHPTPSGNEICKIMGMTAPWLSSVRRSDVFKQELARRRQEFTEQRDIKVQTQLDRIIGKGLSLMADHLEEVDEFDNSPVATFNEVKIASELALKASGYLGNNATQVNVNNIDASTSIQHNTVDASTLMAARQRLINGGDDVKTIEAETPPSE